MDKIYELRENVVVRGNTLTELELNCAMFKKVLDMVADDIKNYKEHCIESGLYYSRRITCDVTLINKDYYEEYLEVFPVSIRFTPETKKSKKLFLVGG